MLSTRAISFSDHSQKLDVKALQEALKKFNNENAIDKSTKTITIDYSKCNNCTFCAQICEKRVFGFSKIGDRAFLQTSSAEKLDKTKCNKCGQCAQVCPTKAIIINSDIQQVKDAIHEHKFEKAIIFFDSNVLSALSLQLNKEIPKKKFITLLRKSGFDMIFNGDIGSDLFIQEENMLLLDAIEKKQFLLSSHCPAFVEYIKKCNNNLKGKISTVKTTTNCLSAIIKSMFNNTYIVSVSSCSAGKESHESNVHLTTKELLDLVDINKLDSCEESDFDPPFNNASGAAIISEMTGGACEAILRTATQCIAGKTTPAIDFASLRGYQDPVKISIVSGLKIGAIYGDLVSEDIARRVIKGDKQLHDVVYLECSTCPGGCINGAGNFPIQDESVLKKRQDRLYKADRESLMRRAHQNPTITRLYQEYLGGSPGSDVAKSILHRVVE